jgi:hypothetical protein
MGATTLETRNGSRAASSVAVPEGSGNTSCSTSKAAERAAGVCSGFVPWSALNCCRKVPSLRNFCAGTESRRRRLLLAASVCSTPPLLRGRALRPLNDVGSDERSMLAGSAPPHRAGPGSRSSRTVSSNQPAARLAIFARGKLSDQQAKVQAMMPTAAFTASRWAQRVGRAGEAAQQLTAASPNALGALGRQRSS